MFQLDMQVKYKVSCIREGVLLLVRETKTDYMVVNWEPKFAYPVLDLNQTRDELNSVLIGSMGYVPGWQIIGRIDCDEITEAMFAKLGETDSASELLRLSGVDRFAYWLAVLIDANRGPELIVGNGDVSKG